MQFFERKNRQNYLTSLSMHSILPGHSIPTREQTYLDHFMHKLNTRAMSTFIAILNTSITDYLMVLLTLSYTSVSPVCTKTKAVVNLDGAHRSLQKQNLHELFIHTDSNILTDLFINKISNALLKHTKILSIYRNRINRNNLSLI